VLKSLFSGISGLQSHQVAMDIEGNNIANVNTTGFKYSRANFSDLLSQTNRVAVAPKGGLGGKNAMQVGMGSVISSSTRIFSQGTTQTTDRKSDIAIQGDGFFVLSSDLGRTFKYTRAGDFKFDSTGNFVDNGGNVVQGWLRNEKTLLVDSSKPIKPIFIAANLRIPANPTSLVSAKANLNSGNKVYNISPIRQLDSFHNTWDLNKDGKAFIDANGNAKVDGGEAVDIKDDLTKDGAYDDKDVNQENLETRLLLDKDGAIVERSEDMGVLFNKEGEAFNLLSAVKPVVAVGAPAATPVGGQGMLVSFNGALYDKLGTRTTRGKEYRYTNVTSDVKTNADAKPVYFKTTEDLRLALQNHARDVNADGTEENSKVEVIVTEKGQYQILNNDDADGTKEDLTIDVQDLFDVNTTPNKRFTTNFQSLSGILTEGSSDIKTSESVNAATHGTSIDIFDSLGAKHTLQIEYRKKQQNKTTGLTWEMIITVPEPGLINKDVNNFPSNKLVENITFTNKGAFANSSLTNINFTANNGSAPNQIITLGFGTVDEYDGVTSFDLTSSSSITQDGYTTGILMDKEINERGTIIGTFSNDRAFALAQISMAKFTNNEGLTADGGNIFKETANSGTPIIGTAATGGRGVIQSSALEGSNADLSRSLTQLIVIQRGFQANSKTITTSDTLLETLIGLKR
jgi:flagellar hook protein FlgE